jgi:hypothetical protein
MQKVRDLRDFALATLHHWGVLVTGVTLTLLLGGIEHFKQASLSWKVYCLILALTFLAACFSAWKDEHYQLVALQSRLQSPEFDCQITNKLWGLDGEGKLVLFVSGLLQNPLGPPSGAKNWRIQLEVGPHKELGRPAMPSEDDTRLPLPNGHTLVFKSSQWWPNITLNAIQAGAATPGWYRAQFNRITDEQIAAYGGTITLLFTDIVSGKDHSTVAPIGRQEAGREN